MLQNNLGVIPTPAKLTEAYVKRAQCHRGCTSHDPVGSTPLLTTIPTSANAARTTRLLPSTINRDV